jgi:hypothetical protein
VQTPVQPYGNAEDCSGSPPGSNLVLLVHKAVIEGAMSNSHQHQLCSVGCQTSIPLELETEGLCLPHFLSSTDRVCSDMRHETAAGGLHSARRTQIQSYVAATAMKLACVGTGGLHVSDEMKRRVLTTFHTLMILRENLNRDVSYVVPRLRSPNATAPVVEAGALG